MSSLFLVLKKYSRRSIFGTAIVVAVALAVLVSDKVFAADGSTVASHGSVSYNGTYIDFALTFSTYHFGSQPYCDGTAGSAAYNSSGKWTTGWNNPITWDTGVAQPGWSKWQGYYIYGIQASVADSHGNIVNGVTVALPNQALNGGSRVVTGSIYAPNLSPGTYKLQYRYDRNHFCESVANRDTATPITFTIPNPLPIGDINSASCDLVTGWSFDPGNPTVANDVHLYFSTDPNKAHPAYSGDPATIGISVNASGNRVLRPDVVAAYGSPPLSSSTKYGYTFSPMGAAPWFHERLGSVFYVNAWGIGKYGNPHIAGPRVFGPCWDYTLTPRTTVNSTGNEAHVHAGDTVTFQTYVDNSGPTKTNSNMWVGTKSFVIPASDSSAKPTVGASTCRDAITSSADAGQIGSGSTPLVTVNDLDCVTVNGGGWQIPVNIWIYKYDPSGTVLNQVWGTGQFGTGTTNFENYSLSTDGLNVGDRLCVSISVGPYRQDGVFSPPRDRISAPACVRIVKSPQLQIRGSDSVSGAKYWGDTNTVIDGEGGFRGSKYTSSSANQNRGSWSQYGLISNGTTASNGKIELFGSAGHTTVTSSNLANACKLWFSNANLDAGGGTKNCKNTTTTAGRFADTSRTINLPAEASLSDAQFNALPSVPKLTRTPDWAAIAPNQSTGLWNIPTSGVYRQDGNLEIWNSTGGSGGGVGADGRGKDITIVVKGDVYITQNIYSDFRSYGYDSLDQMPRLTVIADNIYIKSTVSYIYGTFVANEAFYTCNTGYVAKAAQLGQNGECNQQLQIDGALVAKNPPLWQRVYGGGKDDAATPAEIINYTPNIFLTPFYASFAGNTSWNISGMRALPARY